MKSRGFKKDTHILEAQHLQFESRFMQVIGKKRCLGNCPSAETEYSQFNDIRTKINSSVLQSFFDPAVIKKNKKESKNFYF